jgi:hypothetical protein
MRLLRAAIFAWFCFAAVVALGWWLVAWAPVSEPFLSPAWQLPRTAVGLTIIGAALALYWRAWRETGRCFSHLRQECSPDYLAWLIRDLDSPEEWKRFNALHRIAAICGYPFGRLTHQTPSQLNALIRLHQEWMAARKQIGEDISINDVTIRIEKKSAPTALPAPMAERREKLGSPCPQPLELRCTLGKGHAKLAQQSARGHSFEVPMSNDYPPEPPRPVPVLRLTERLVNDVRGQDDGVFTRWADFVKDLMLDWDYSGDDDEPEPITDELPRMSEHQFVEALRGKVEETLQRIAQTINEAPTGKIIEASEEKVCRMLAELWTKALQLGVQMRLEAAEAEMSPGVKPQGEWAIRLRRMLAGGGGMSLANEAEQPTTGEPAA